MSRCHCYLRWAGTALELAIRPGVVVAGLSHALENPDSTLLEKRQLSTHRDPPVLPTTVSVPAWCSVWCHRSGEPLPSSLAILIDD